MGLNRSTNPEEGAMNSVYLFSVGPDTPPIQTIDPGAEVSLVVRGAFADVEDIGAIPTPFTPACDQRQRPGA